MLFKRFRPKIMGAVLGLVGLSLAPGAAQAQPAVPPVLPWMPGPPLPVSPTMGSYTFAPNVMWVTNPFVTDARNVRASASLDPTAVTSGLPGSQLGLTANRSNSITGSSTRYRVNGGESASPTLPSVAAGVQAGAGMEVPTLEDPGGAAPKSAVGAESSEPATAAPVPGAPVAPILEAAGGSPAAAAPSSPAASGSPSQ